MIYELLEKRKSSREKAVVCGNQSITYKDLYTKSSVLGKNLENYSSEIVVLFMPNSIEYVVSYFAVLSCNKIVYPVSYLSKYSELVSSLKLTNSKLVLCTKQYYNDIKQISLDMDVDVLIVDNENLSKDEIPNLKCRSDIDIEKTCVLLNTSGSTDKHKIVMLSERGIRVNCEDWIDIALYPNKKSNVLLALPISTCVGNVVMITCIMLGWTIVLLPSFLNTNSILNAIVNEKITHIISVGSMLNILAADIKNIKYDERYDSIEFIGVGGNVSIETIESLMNYFKNAGISPGYGMTEATCMVSTIPPNISKTNKHLFFEKISSAGLVFKHFNVKISDVNLNIDADESLKKKNVGEILINSPTIMNGYYNNERETHRVINNGFLHTGDVGYFDEDGFLYVVGRIKNIIKSGGYTVFPEEVETVLEKHQMIKEAFVYGTHDSILGERIECDVVVNDESINVSQIKRYCRDNLADYKIPAKINIVAHIQKTKTGKIKRVVNLSDQ